MILNLHTSNIDIILSRFQFGKHNSLDILTIVQVRAQHLINQANGLYKSQTKIKL